MSPSITEQPNPITSDIDRSSASGILRLLRQVDTQLFTGYSTYDTFTDPAVTASLSRLTAAFQRTLTAPDGGAIVFVGAGTSGRIGTLAAHRMQRDIDTYCCRYNHDTQSHMNNNMNNNNDTDNNNTDNNNTGIDHENNNDTLHLNPLPEQAQHTRCRSLMAGGPLAMVRAQESAEDSAAAGYGEVADMIAEVEQEREKEKVKDGTAEYEYHHVVVGITVGLSAPYVGGALEYAVEYNNTEDNDGGDDKDDSRPIRPRSRRRRSIAAVLLTFNPLSCARDVPLNNTTLPRLVHTLHQCSAGIVIAPVTGPEAITGSTRMKGGTGTAIAINAAWTACLHGLMHGRGSGSSHGDEEKMRDKDSISSSSFNSSTPTPLSLLTTSTSTSTSITSISCTISSILQHLAAVLHSTYTTAVPGSLPSLMESAATTLRRQHHICYLAHGSLSPWAFVDAAECPPTFGADVHDVRGYVDGGWRALGLSDDLYYTGPDYHIDIDSFTQEIAPTLEDGDLVVVFHPISRSIRHNRVPSAIRRAIDQLQQRGVSVWMVRIRVDGVSGPGPTSIHAGNTVDIKVPPTPPTMAPLGRDATDSVGIAGKIVLNAVSTAAHVMSGTTYGNAMVSLRVSNSKLYHRAIAIIARMSHVSTAVATRCLHAAIHDPSPSDKGNNNNDTVPSPGSALTHDNVPEDEERAEDGRAIAEHVEVALQRDRVIPTAILLARGTVDQVSTARRLLSACPVVRRVLDDVEGSSY